MYCDRMYYLSFVYLVWRFVDALTPTVSILHPISVLNHLHMSCIGKVQSVNVLKKDKYLSQLQGGGSKRSTAERVKNLPKDSSGLHEPYSVFEEFIASQIQGTLILPKVCLLLKSSIFSLVQTKIKFLFCFSRSTYPFYKPLLSRKWSHSQPLIIFEI